MLQANFELAELTYKVGKPADALAAHRQVLAAWESLAAEAPAKPEIKADVGRQPDGRRLLAGHHRTNHRVGGVIPQGRGTTCHPGPEDCEGRGGAGCPGEMPVESRLATPEHGPQRRALSVYRLARADQEALAAAPGATAESRRQLADTINRVAILLKTTGKSLEAEAEYRKALTIFQKLVDDNRDVTAYRGSLARSHSNLGVVLAEMGKSSDAEAEFRTALAQYQKLADDNFAVTDFRNSLARSHSNLGTLLSHAQVIGSRGRVPRGPLVATNAGRRQSCRHRIPQQPGAKPQQPCQPVVGYGQVIGGGGRAPRGAAIREKLADDNPAVTEFRSDLAQSHYNLGLLLWKTGRSSEAEAESQKALTIRQKLADDNPAVTDFRDSLASSHYYLAWVFQQTGKVKEAEAEFRKVLAIRQKLADDDPRRR